jgi:hypothetical protein
MPAQAGIQQYPMDSRLRGNDKNYAGTTKLTR